MDANLRLRVFNGVSLWKGEGKQIGKHQSEALKTDDGDSRSKYIP